MHVTSPIFDLTGQNALVTGGGRGLGWEIAKALSNSGARVFINGRNHSALEAKISTDWSESDQEGPGQLEPAAFDVTDETAAEGWMADSGENLNILVNNVGLRSRKTIENCTSDDFSEMLDVNLTASYRMARIGAKIMTANPGANNNIINITSIAGPRARAGDAAYTAAKGGLEALTRALAMELGPNGIRVNAISPGFFATEANREMMNDPDIQNFVETRIPFKRWGEPAEIAGAAVFLASPAASYVNGHVLMVDAGLSVRF